jgi:hypothetical protein
MNGYTVIMIDDIKRVIEYLTNTWYATEIDRLEVTMIGEDGTVVGVVKWNADEEYAFFPAVQNGVVYE